MTNIRLAIIGMGYVGLPLAVEFGKTIKTIGFDLNKERISELKLGKDKTLEVELNTIIAASKLSFTSVVGDLEDCNVYIVAVPTPINESNEPNLEPLSKACEIVGKCLKSNDVVIFESTVFPGATEECCVPILEKMSQLTFNQDFYCGYSPERINPGDKKHSLTKIIKITSGSNSETADFVDNLYNLIIEAGTHKVSSIRVAEAAKIIENTQRDVNIALINELAIIFKKMNIDTQEVLLAAGTKWNFIPFSPGLVGGHCIGVDPYYLTYKAKQLGYEPNMILAGRKINDSMANYVAEEIVELLRQRNITLQGAHVLIMGLTFKENCTDIRNTKVVDLSTKLQNFDLTVEVFDPWVDKKEAQQKYGIELKDQPVEGKYQAIIIAVSHDIFSDMGIKTIESYGDGNHIIYDVRYLFSVDEVDARI